MNYVEKILDKFQEAIQINPATFSGAVDVIVVKQKDGSFKSTPFHVRFGKLQLMNIKESVKITLTINGVESPLKMKLGDAGEAYFEDPNTSSSANSPIDEAPYLINNQDYIGSAPIPISSRKDIIGFSPMKETDILQSRSLNYKYEPDFELQWKSGSLPNHNAEYENILKKSNKSTSPQENPNNNNTGNNNSTTTANIAVTQKAPENGKQSWFPRLINSMFSRSSEQKRDTKKLEERSHSHENKNDSDDPATEYFSDNEEHSEEEISNHNGNIFAMEEDDDLKSSNKSIGNIETVSSDNEEYDMSDSNRRSYRSDSSKYVNILKVSNNENNTTTPSTSPIPNSPLSSIFTDSVANIQDQIELSLCGNIIYDPSFDKSKMASVFEKNKVDYSKFSSIISRDPNCLNQMDFVFRIQDNYLPWSLAGPILVSRVLFGKFILPTTSINQSMTIPSNISSTSSSTPSSSNNKNSWYHYIPWFSRNKKDSSTGDTVSNGPNTPTHINSSSSEIPIASSSSSPVKERYTVSSPNSPSVEGMQIRESEETRVEHHVISNGSPDALVTSEQITTTESIQIPQVTPASRGSSKPTSQQIEQMNLLPGANTVIFTVKSALQGERYLTSTIYLWDKDDKIVISDIDGTITKSDVMGQILPIFGRDWSHDGVVQLYNNVVNNGYRIVYLTARAIGQAGVTKSYLMSLTQNGDGKRMQLPDGPLMMSPDRILYSINREVIQRTPEKFKVACLEDIRAVFILGEDGQVDKPGCSPSSTTTEQVASPSSSSTAASSGQAEITSYRNPLYAGFGNRKSDTISYQKVGISDGRIFIINHFGEISCASGAYNKTYTKLNELVDEIFPPINPKTQIGTEKCNDWQYWKTQKSDLAELEAELFS
eukprot:TRINITY_DN2750_c0_g1_i12.p1 TRINITY_DN2750_c0_g1~~TRINITY_DN2750_c0_g1_i12.p1  ORF type:complete len:883 (+),score=223.06 TRINITY_DN2750_c0_g1_i12:54-2702(+)